MRPEFKDIVSGWVLTDDFELLTEIIERAADWTVSNGPLLQDEQSTVSMMIERQIVLGLEIYPLVMPDGSRMRFLDTNRN